MIREWSLLSIVSALGAGVIAMSMVSSMSAHPAQALPSEPGQGRQGQAPPRFSSRIMVYDLDSNSARLVHHAPGVWEAPNWSRDGGYLLVNSGGRLYRVPVGGGEPSPIALDPALRANNDHDFSPDGKMLAISASTQGSGGSQIYLSDADGTNHRLLVSAVPSYFHGWSPDGRYVSYVANRDKKQYDLYRISVDGGPEERLTVDLAHEDGTDYSPDGKWIYFNSDRAGGSNSIWRMPATGAGPNDHLAERVTNDSFEDWFPHPSPDGRHLLFISFPAGTVGHNARDMRVQFRLLPLPGERVVSAEPRVIHSFMGGQGTINVNSWAPDSRSFAYVEFAAPLP
jgi:TolB protein